MGNGKLKIENYCFEHRKHRSIILSVAKNLLLMIALFFAVGLSSCADVNGLHNQESSSVTFVFKNFPADNGAYALPGDHNDWDNTTEEITLTDGAGTSKTYTYTSSSLEFTLVKKGTWFRKWSKTDGGTIDGEGRTGTDKARNFLIENIDLGSDITITVDGSTPVATVTMN
ncbi:MAG: hypothetical protein IJ158_04365 [Treponema sp.]|nr:hypothetical protein [Treponema sp.]